MGRALWMLLPLPEIASCTLQNAEVSALLGLGTLPTGTQLCFPTMSHACIAGVKTTSDFGRPLSMYKRC